MLALNKLFYFIHSTCCIIFTQDVRLGEARVGQLEKALEMCHSELQGHVSKIQADTVHHEEIIKAYKHQVIEY